MDSLKIIGLTVHDIRFPTSLGGHGSDALHKDPNYSCAYVILKTNSKYEGYGLTFTLGRGTEIVVLACEAMKHFLINKNVHEIFDNFGVFWRTITSDCQMRWIGPEKGVVHLAVAAIINALWDLWARLESKPLWKLLVDMKPEKLVSCIDFRYITDVITPDEALKVLKSAEPTKKKRIDNLLNTGYLAYTTQVGWLGYSDELVATLTKKYIDLGFDNFKIKVGVSIEDDYKRCKATRQAIGKDRNLMVDANQAWDVKTAIEWMTKLAEFKPLWIEEPTSPDDVLGHATISQALKPLGIGVATGEMCANRVMFKQFMQANAMQFCQIDSARIGGVNEILAVYLMAKMFNVKVCPHAGGVGLCEMVQHLQMWDYVSLSCTMDGRFIEFVDQQHEHFVNPTIVKNAHYMAPKEPGYSTKMWEETIDKYQYPNGTEWKRMLAEGLFDDQGYLKA